MTKIAVFDFDGTIADTKKLYYYIIHKAINSRGYNLSLSHVEKNLGPKLEITLRDLKVAEKDINPIRNEVHAYAVTKVNSLKTCPYTAQTLARLKKQKVKIILMTNSIRKFVLGFLNKNKLAKYFDALLCAEDFKEKPEAFRKIFKKYNVKPQDVLYVADKTWDVRIARQVGCGIAIVLARSWDKSRFGKESYVFKDLRSVRL